MEDSRQEEEEEEVNATTGGLFISEICVEPVSENKNSRKIIAIVVFTIFCVNCVVKYVETKVKENPAKIKCPGLNCEQVSDPTSCRKIVPQSVFAKWCDVLCDSYVLGLERSYCPNRNCRELVVNECRGQAKKSKCPNSKELFCFEYKAAWNAGYGCEESRNMSDHIDILFGQVTEKKAG